MRHDQLLDPVVRAALSVPERRAIERRRLAKMVIASVGCDAVKPFDGSS